MLKRNDEIQYDYIKLADRPTENLELGYTEDDLTIVDPLQRGEISNYNFFCNVGKAKFDQQYQQFVMIAAQMVENLNERAPPQISAIVKKGRFFIVKREGIYQLNGNHIGVFITDAQIKIISFLHEHSSTITKVYYKVQVFNEIIFENYVILSQEYRRIYQNLRSDSRFNNFKIPANLIPLVIDDYLVEVFKSAYSVPIEHVFLVSGWFEMDGKIRYSTSNRNKHRYYQRRQFSPQEEATVFINGNNWLSIGNNATVVMLWLLAHSQFVQYLLNKAGIRQEFIIFLKGLSDRKSTRLNSSH